MSYIVSINQAQPVPQADATGEKPVVPEVYDIPDGEYTVPIATAHLDKVTVTADPVVDSGGEVATVEARATPDAAWYELTTLDITSGAASELLNAPIGQIRVKQDNATSARIYVQGVSQSK